MVPMGVVPSPVLCGACLPVATGFRDQLVPTCLEGWPVPGEAWAPARLARAEGRALRRQVSDSGAQPFRGQSRLMAFLLGPGAAQEAADPHNEWVLGDLGGQGPRRADCSDPGPAQP